MYFNFSHHLMLWLLNLCSTSYKIIFMTYDDQRTPGEASQLVMGEGGGEREGLTLLLRAVITVANGAAWSIEF